MVSWYSLWSRCRIRNLASSEEMTCRLVVAAVTTIVLYARCGRRHAAYTRIHVASPPPRAGDSDWSARSAASLLVSLLVSAVLRAWRLTLQADCLYSWQPWPRRLQPPGCLYTCPPWRLLTRLVSVSRVRLECLSDLRDTSAVLPEQCFSMVPASLGCHKTRHDRPCHVSRVTLCTPGPSQYY